MGSIEIRRYRAASGVEPFSDWLLRLRDRQAKARVLVMLLVGGDKRTQATDIRRALEYWQDYKRRSGFNESA